MTQDTTTKAVDLVEAIASFVEGWNGDTRDGDTSCMAEGIRERFASLPLPESRTEPQEVVEADLAACDRAIERMGWDEIRAFMGEPGQSPYEDAGGHLLRKIKTLFGIKPDRLETYREAARRLVAEAKAQDGGSMKDRTAALSTPPKTDEGLAEKAVQEAIEIVWNDPHQRPNPHLIELSLRARLRERGYDITALNRDSKAVELLLRRVRAHRQGLPDPEHEAELYAAFDQFLRDFKGDSDVK